MLWRSGNQFDALVQPAFEVNRNVEGRVGTHTKFATRVRTFLTDDLLAKERRTRGVW